MTDTTITSLPHTPHDGSRTARRIAREHAAAGRHTHLVTDTEIECVSGRCTPTAATSGAPTR